MQIKTCLHPLSLPRITFCEVVTMKKAERKYWFVFAGAVLLGFLLHFLYDWLPNPVTAVFSPVKESLWEHVKLVFWPLLLAGSLLAGKGERAVRSAWQLSAILSSLAMLAVAYVYHILLGGEGLAFDIALYVIAIVVGFLLPRKLWSLTKHPGWSWTVGLLTCIMAALVVWFSFSPPDHVLFADLSGGVRTFLTIPV